MDTEEALPDAIWAWPAFKHWQTGQWSANTFYDGRAVKFIPAEAAEARIAELEAYHTAAKSVFKAGVMNATHEQWSALENARAALASGATPLEGKS